LGLGRLARRDLGARLPPDPPDALPVPEHRPAPQPDRPMSAPPLPKEDPALDGLEDEASTVAQAGSVAFPELVRAHYEWEQSAQTNSELEARFRRKLEEFRALEGELESVYWATRRPSAV